MIMTMAEIVLLTVVFCLVQMMGLTCLTLALAAHSGRNVNINLKYYPLITSVALAIWVALFLVKYTG
jgi:hypothetical protein